MATPKDVTSYNTKVGVTQEGDQIFIKSGGTLQVLGKDCTPTATGVPVDGIAMSGVKYVDVTVTAAALDAASQTGTALVIAGVTGDQYKIREVILHGGGTNFGAGGDHTIILTDGTTTWTSIANADIESAPSASLRWGDTKVPFLTDKSNVASASGSDIVFKYGTGSAAHTTGSISFTVCLEKVA